MKKISLILIIGILLQGYQLVHAGGNVIISALEKAKKLAYNIFIKPFDTGSLKKLLGSSKIGVFDEYGDFKGEDLGVKNVKVLSQSGASCGYNALRNGILIAQGRGNDLLNKDIATDLYGTDTYNSLMGFWRRAVIAKRTGILQQQGIEDIDKALEKYNERCKEKGYTTMDLSGELLDDCEIQMLIDYERNDGCLLTDNKLPITIIEDISIFDIPEQGDMNNEEYQTVLEVAKSVASAYGFDDIKEKCNDSTYKHVFILGTMKRNNKTGSAGAAHWFTMVIRNGKCYVADSLGYDRSEDAAVEKVLELIGKKDTSIDTEKLNNIEQELDILSKRLQETNDEEEYNVLQVSIFELKEKYKRLGGDIKKFDEINS